MLPSNQRSSSTRPSRSTHHRTNSSSNNGARAYIIRRAVSVPQRQFIFILTNHPDLLQQTQVAQTLQEQGRPLTNGPQQNHNQNENNREVILHNLLRLELREAAQSYLVRTRQIFPLTYVFDMTDIEPSPASS